MYVRGPLGIGSAVNEGPESAPPSLPPSFQVPTSSPTGRTCPRIPPPQSPHFVAISLVGFFFGSWLCRDEYYHEWILQGTRVDLEKELTCSICTDLIYQPLSCLDCLHTFCGSCLKEWFTFQAATIEKAPVPPTPDTVLFTCPSCRAPVRDTRRNATFVTLLEMLLDVHPEKGRTEADKEDMARKYRPGDEVIPKVTVRERTAEERRADEEDQRLIDQVREMSLREAEGGAPLLPPRPRRRTGSRSRSGEPEQHRTRESGRHRTEHSARRSADQLNPEPERRRGRRSESRQRQVEHQSSLRSLISSADIGERDIEREIEDFARQIQEEGLLDGLDLDNIDLTRDDELSRRITEAYRRRQRERTRQERVRRSNHSGHSGSMRPENNRSESRNSARAPRSRSNSRPHAHSRSASASRYMDDRSRPPPSMSANLDVRDRVRRRTGSGGRSTTAPIPTLSSNSDARPAARSQTDLSVRSQTSDLARPRPDFTEERRSSSTPNVPASNPPAELPVTNAGNLQSFASRANQVTTNVAHEAPPSELPTTPPAQTEDSFPTRENRPAELAVVSSTVTSPLSPHGHTTPSGGGHQRSRSQLYPEPSITCARCRKTHIEYELHYNCHICSDGQWNICLDCYRAGKGCQYWFGFGYGAWTKWEKVRKQKPDKQLPTPHMMTASRYMPPSSTPGGADGRKTLTTDDPRNRLESGTFCARCFVWTNQCYWRCDVCNEGDWGFCNNCVNQGKSCTHALLPLSHEATQTNNGRPVSPRSPGRPPAATVFTGPSASSIGPFKPLTFHTRCDICQDQIPPQEPRYHCFQCTSALIADAVAGDYDICFSCYNNIVAHGEISFENGPSGWRRCLNGHRMAIVGFTEGKIGMWRYVDRDMVGGRALRAEPYDISDYRGQGLQKWSWSQGEQKWERLVTKDVKAMSPPSDGTTTFTQSFPPDGGVGFKATAKFAWHPQAGVDDELMFPRGAEIREIEEVTGEWYHGVYMGDKGLFPSNYVRPEQSSG